MQKTDSQKPKGPQRKTDAASLIHRYVAISPAQARAIAQAMPADVVAQITEATPGAKVVELVNAHLVTTSKASADAAQAVGETAE